MSAVDFVLPRLETEESFRPMPYKDTKGLTTVGYGFCVDRGITRRCAGALLQEEIAEAHDSLVIYPWYAGLNAPRQSVCLDIAINAGIHGLLEFPSMIHYLSVQDWPNAAAQCRVANPELAPRYESLAKIILTGAA